MITRSGCAQRPAMQNTNKLLLSELLVETFFLSLPLTNLSSRHIGGNTTQRRRRDASLTSAQMDRNTTRTYKSWFYDDLRVSFMFIIYDSHPIVFQRILKLENHANQTSCTVGSLNAVITLHCCVPGCDSNKQRESD